MLTVLFRLGPSFYCMASFLPSGNLFTSPCGKNYESDKAPWWLFCFSTNLCFLYCYFLCFHCYYLDCWMVSILPVGLWAVFSLIFNVNHVEINFGLVVPVFDFPPNWCWIKLLQSLFVIAAASLTKSYIQYYVNFYSKFCLNQYVCFILNI